MLHVIGWGVLVGIVAPQHYQVSSTQVLGVGLGLTAYTLGMRHAFDADHIAAIDNTTRKLMAEGKRPVSVLPRPLDHRLRIGRAVGNGRTRSGWAG